MRTIFLAIIATVLCAGSAIAQRNPKKEGEARVQELEVLRSYLAEARDSLQLEITDRWRSKQRFVEQREIDKDEISRLREEQERAFTDLGQLKEEMFARQRRLEDKRREVLAKADEWEFVANSLEEGFEKDAKLLAEGNPLEIETRRERFEQIRREFSTTRNIEHTLGVLAEYNQEYLNRARVFLSGKQVVMPDEGDPQTMTVVRFGNIVAYALAENGDPFVIRQTGNLGTSKYTVEEVGEPTLAAQIQQELPQWQRLDSTLGTVTLDVMQNNNSSLLLSGKRVSFMTQAAAFLKAGGPVLVPIAALMVWAVILIGLKLVLFRIKHRGVKDLYDIVAGLLRDEKRDEALSLARSRKGVVARVVQACLEHSQWTRSSAEKAVREILVNESPQLNKHLATLGVIAGAAPLLGLLGTVTGMISLFEVITHYGTSDPKILAGGISEALITTQVGLSVAIPVLLIHNYLRNQSAHIHAEMEKHAVRILNRLWPEK